MKRIAVAFAVLLFATPLAHSDMDTTRATLRQHVLRLINRDRALYNLPPVALDAHASAIGDEYCRVQIRNRTTGHFTTDGLAPYARYSFAGGNDAVSENAAAWSADYTFSDRALYEMARRSQDAMMAETPPNDGHKRTLLDPHATHVGIGLAWQGGEFRLVHEFIRRYVDWTRELPRAARVDQTVLLGGMPKPGVAIEGITVHHEPLPQAIAATTASAISTYSLPDRRREYAPRVRTRGISLARRDDFTLRSDGSFAFTVPFPDGPGLYTVVVWVKKDGQSAPFPASNVSIRVEGDLLRAGRTSAPADASSALK
jgi:uncharacterized protein YkwD